jgi:hypothetical protein
MATQIDTAQREVVLIEEAHIRPMMGLDILEPLPSARIPYPMVDPYILVHEAVVPILGLGQPARLLCLGRRQRHLRRRRAETRPHPGSRPRADLPAQPEARGRSRVCRLRAEQLRRKGSRDPPGAARPHPRRPHPPDGRLLSGPTRQIRCQPCHTRRTHHDARRDAGHAAADVLPFQ